MSNPVITTQRDLIRAVAKRWRNQYQPFTDRAPLFSERNGYSHKLTKHEIASLLDALDGETATADEVNNIIGNKYWTTQTCDQCGRDVDAVVIVGAEENYESSTARLCAECVETAARMMRERAK